VDYSVGGLLEEPHEYRYKYRTSSQTVDHHQVIQLILNQFYSAVQLHFQQIYIIDTLQELMKLSTISVGNGTWRAIVSFQCWLAVSLMVWKALN
jgi:hypothetical protein